MMIKILQISVTGVFVLLVIVGILIVIFMPAKITVFKDLIGILTPTFITVVVPALVGTPLTEAVRNITAKKGE